MNPPLPSSPELFPAPRVTPNPWHAFGGIWRLTVRRMFTPMHWLVLAGLLVALALVSLGFHTRGNGATFYVMWFQRFYVLFLVPVMAFISGAGAIRDDLKAGSVDYLFTRPVSRRAFVVFRYLSHLACAQVDFLVAFGVMVGVGLYRQSPGLLAAVPLLLLAQVITIAAFSAFGLLCGMLTTRYGIIGMFYGGIVEVGIGNIPTELNRLSMTQQVHAMLVPVIQVGGMTPSEPVAGVLTTVAILVAFAAVMIAVAAMVFSLREFSGTASADA